MTTTKTPTLDAATELTVFLQRIRDDQEGGLDRFAATAARYRVFETESRRAASEYSAGSGQRLKHLEGAERSARKARACELVHEGAAIPVAVASVVSGAVEAAAPAPAAEPTKGKKVTTSKKSRDKGAKDGAPEYWKELEAAVLACGTEAELNLLVHERKLGKKDFPEHKERLGGVGQYWTNLQVVIGNQREAVRASDLATIEGEIAEGAGERFYRVCQAMNEYHGLIGQERERTAEGLTVLLELPDGGDWIEEQFDRTLLVPTTREAFEQQPAAAGAFKTEVTSPTPPASAEKKKTIAPPIAKTTISAHRWRGATWLTAGECVVCARQKNTPVHKVEERTKRLKAGLPANTAGDWLGYALHHADYSGNWLKNPFKGKKLTRARARDWQGRLDKATEELRLSWTLYNLAQAVEAGTLPEALHGLTNDLQVRDAVKLILLGRTAGDVAGALAPYVPEVEPFTVEAECVKQGVGAEQMTEGGREVAEETPPSLPLPASRVGRRFKVKVSSPKRLYDCVGVCVRDEGTGVVLDVEDFRGKREERVYPNSAVLMLEEEQPTEQDDDPTAFGKAPEDEHLFPFAGTEYSDGGLLQPYGCKLCETMMPVSLAPAREHVRRWHAGSGDPSADPRKCEACEVVYDTNNPAEAEMHQHPDDQETLKGQAIVRQLVKCGDPEALALALSRYRLDDLEGVPGLTSADRKEITDTIAARRERFAEREGLLVGTIAKLEALTDAPTLAQVEEIENELEQELKGRGLFLTDEQSERLGTAGNAARDRVYVARKPPRYLHLKLVGDTRPTSRVGKYLGHDCGLYVVELPTGETTKVNEVYVKGDATEAEFEALKPARPTQPTPVEGVGPEKRCPECAYKLPMHNLTCRTGQREQEAA